MSSHDFGVILSQNPFLNQALDKPGEIPQHIGIILLGLQLRQRPILELFDHQHFSRPADGGIVEDIADLALNHLNSVIGSLRKAAGIFLPIRPCKK